MTFSHHYKPCTFSAGWLIINVMAYTGLIATLVEMLGAMIAFYKYDLKK